MSSTSPNKINPAFQEINSAVLALNRTMSKHGYRFILIAEGFENESDDDDDDDTDSMSSQLVAPNHEVSSYPIEKLLISKGDIPLKSVDDKTPDNLVYSSQFSLLMSGALLGSAMLADEKIYDLVQYAYLSGRMENSAIDLLSHEEGLDGEDDTDSYENHSIDDIDDDD